MSLSPSGINAKLHFAVLDGLRGGAAVYVMLYHSFGVLVAAAEPRAGRSWWEWAQVAVVFLFLNGRGMVMLFFVLSGVVIHLRLAQERASGSLKFDTADYARRRAARLFPPLVAALIFTAVLDAVGRSINPAYYAGDAPGGGLGLALQQADSSWTTLLGNLLFLQGLAVPTFGTNGVLWSLSYEAFFYTAYALAFAPLYRRRGPSLAFGLGWLLSLAGYGLLAVSEDMRWTWLAYFGLWLLGAVIAEVLATNWQIRYERWLFSLAILGLMTLAGLDGRLPTAIDDTLWACMWALLMISLLPASRWAPLFYTRRLIESLRPFALQSYTLYLFHVPLILFLSATYLSYSPTLPGHFGLVAVAAVLNLGLTSLLARWLEALGRTRSKAVAIHNL